MIVGNAANGGAEGITPVPEPYPMALFGIAAIGLMGIMAIVLGFDQSFLLISAITARLLPNHFIRTLIFPNSEKDLSVPYLNATAIADGFQSYWIG